MDDHERATSTIVLVAALLLLGVVLTITTHWVTNGWVVLP